MSNHIIIGSRGSRLALWQANFTASSLQDAGYSTEIKVIKTKGDQIQHLSFDKIEGKGFFTTEIENALRAEEIDMAVHSLKDLPTQSESDLRIAGLSYREDPADLLIIDKGSFNQNSLLRLPNGAKIGTSSARRKAQVHHIRPDLQFEDIRGNVPTRLKKLESLDLDAIILAAAGINRLEIELESFECIRLHPREFPPAPGQGVLAFQCRSNDERMLKAIRILHQDKTAQCTNVERKVMQLLGGGCHAPLGVYCEKDVNQNFHVWAQYAEKWNDTLAQTKVSLGTHVGLAKAVFDSLQLKAS